MPNPITTSNSPQYLDRENRSVVVIGGGLAGIAASLALAKKGIAVTLLESKRRLGGRAGSFTTCDKSGREQTVDYCQHVGMGCCSNLRTLISWLGQDAMWQEQTQLHFYGPTGKHQRLSALPLLPAPLHLAGWLLAWPGLSWRDRLSVARGIWFIHRMPLDDSLDDVSAQTWFEQTRQSAGAIQHFWSTIVVSALGEKTDRVSLAALCKVIRDGFLKDRQAFHLLVPKQPLDQLFNRVAHTVLLSQGVQVQLATQVRYVDPQDERFAIHRAGQDLPMTADAVVLAVPWHQLSQLSRPETLPGLKWCDSDFAALESSPITGIHTWWDRAWLDTPHAAIVGRLCQWVFPKTTNAPTTPSSVRSLTKEHYYQIVISASHAFPDSSTCELGAVLQEDLSQVFPRVRTSKLLRFKAVTDPNAVFSTQAGALKFRPPSKSNIPNLWLAGDWTRTGWPSTMESAITSGFLAADGIAESWKRPAQLTSKLADTT